MESYFWLKHLAKYNPSAEAEFNSKSRLQTFGVETIEEADEVAKSISALALISTDDPPIFMQYGMPPNAPAPSKDDPKKLRGWIVHHVDFGVALKEKMDELGVEADLRYPGANTKYNSLVEFFADKIPGVDNGWDTVHTFIRIPIGALLAAAAVGEVNPSIAIAAALLGGGMAA